MKKETSAHTDNRYQAARNQSSHRCHRTNSAQKNKGKSERIAPVAFAFYLLPFALIRASSWPSRFLRRDRLKQPCRSCCLCRQSFRCRLFKVLPLWADLDHELHFTAFDCACNRRFSKLAFIIACHFFAFLLQGEYGSACSIRSLDREIPHACDIRVGCGGCGSRRGAWRAAAPSL